MQNKVVWKRLKQSAMKTYKSKNLEHGYKSKNSDKKEYFLMPA
jgi:hypothetical protein